MKLREPGAGINEKKKAIYQTNHIFKLWKVNDKIFWKKQEGGDLVYRRAKIRTIFDFSIEYMQARREWSEIFKVLRGKKIYLESVLSKIILESTGEIKSSSDKQKLNKFVTSRITFQEMIKWIF